MAKDKIKSIKGFKDILSDEARYYRYLESLLLQKTLQHHIEEIRFPILEKSELFNRTIGESSDIITKEMYDFIDKNGDSICLRPEGTASLVRTAIEHNLIYDRGIKKQKYWYYGPMFRHEKPQRGRYRQFNQFGIEFFGYSDTNSDLEVISFGDKLFKELSLENITLYLNSLGSYDDRVKYKKVIVDYLSKSIDVLTDEQKNTLSKNPLRLLDNKSENIQKLLKGIPKLYDNLSKSSKKRYDRLLDKLSKLGITFINDNSIVRGLDYYNDTVFEWRHNNLGSHGAICAGGRYDNLVNSIGGCNVPAIGFAIGVERVVDLLKNVPNKIITSFTIPIINLCSEDSINSIEISDKLRSKYPTIGFINTDSSSSFSSQVKHSLKINDEFIIIITDKNVEENKVTVRHKSTKMSDMNLSINELYDLIGKSYE